MLSWNIAKTVNTYVQLGGGAGERGRKRGAYVRMHVNTLLRARNILCLQFLAVIALRGRIHSCALVSPQRAQMPEDQMTRSFIKC